MLAHSTSNYSMQTTMATTPLKLVDVVFTKNLESLALKKCQIPLLVDDCPALILQFDQQQLLLHQNVSSLYSSHECCSNICNSQQHQQKSVSHLKHTVNNTSNNKTCNICNSLSNAHKKDYDTFLNKYNKCSSSNDDSKSNDELELELDSEAVNLNESSKCRSCNSETKSNLCKCSNQHTKCPRIVATQNEVMSTLSKLVSCIGCRTSVERFYKQLVCANNSRKVNLLNLDKNMQRKNGSNYSGRGGLSAGLGLGGNVSALDPFIIKANGNISLKKSVLMDPLSIYKLFYLNCSNLDQIIDQISRCKKSSRRCNLHSLEFTQKQKLITDWLPVWDAFENDDCRAKSIIIDTAQLMNTLEIYLRRHKFCGDCKMKVIRAFNILTGDVDHTKEKGYCSSLYDGIECCCIKSDSTIIATDETKTTGTDSSSSHIKTPNTSPKANQTPNTPKASENSSETCDDTCTCANNMPDSSALNSCCNQPNNQHYLHNHVNDHLSRNHLHHEHSHHHNNHNHDGHDEKFCSSSASSSSSSSPCTSPRTCKHTIDTNKYKFHSNEQHLHLKTDKKFIADLIIRAEPEIQGSRRERHAKTLDIAQEEVLTCIGIHLYERFHRIYQSMKTEEQTWQLLFYTSISTLKKSFEVEFEKLQGISNIELLCAEFEALDESRQTRKRMKKERKKKNKRNNNNKCVLELESQQSHSESLSSLLISSTTSSSSTSSNKRTNQLKNTSPTLLPTQSPSKTKSKVSASKINITKATSKNKNTSENDSGNDFEEDDNEEDEEYIEDEVDEEEDDEEDMEDVENSSNEAEDEEYEDEDDENTSKRYLNESNFNINHSIVSNPELKQKKVGRNLNELDDLDDPILFSSSGSSRVTSSSSSSCSTTSLKNASPNNGSHLKLENNFPKETSIERKMCNASNDTTKNTLANQSCSCFLLNQVYESYDSVNCDEDHTNDSNNNNNYNNVNSSMNIHNNSEDLVLITDEEKNEYYANKSLYLTERKNRREMLEAQFQSFKLNSSFKIKPRNVS